MKNKEKIKKFLSEASGASVWVARLGSDEMGYVVGATEDEAFDNAFDRWGSNAGSMTVSQLSPGQLRQRRKTLEAEKLRISARLERVEKELALMATL